MSWSVCEYSGKVWTNCRRIDDKRVELLSDNVNNKEETQHMTREIVSIDKITSYYRMSCSIIYNGFLFEPLGLNKNTIKKGRIFISTAQSELMELLELKCYDKMSWGKYISIEDIEGMILEREYWIGEKRGLREREEKEKENSIYFLANSLELI